MPTCISCQSLLQVSNFKGSRKRNKNELECPNTFKGCKRQFFNDNFSKGEIFLIRDPKFYVAEIKYGPAGCNYFF